MHRAQRRRSINYKKDSRGAEHKAVAHLGHISLCLSLSPCCSDGGDPRGSVGACSRARESFPPFLARAFPARPDSHSCGIHRCLGGRLGVRGDTIRETVMVRQTPRFRSHPDAKARTRRRIGDAVKTMIIIRYILFHTGCKRNILMGILSGERDQYNIIIILCCILFMKMISIINFICIEKTITIRKRKSQCYICI
jgi:hypothetical protein